MGIVATAAAAAATATTTAARNRRGAAKLRRATANGARKRSRRAVLPCDALMLVTIAASASAGAAGIVIGTRKARNDCHARTAARGDGTCARPWAAHSTEYAVRKAKLSLPPFAVFFCAVCRGFGASTHEYTYIYCVYVRRYLYMLRPTSLHVRVSVWSRRGGGVHLVGSLWSLQLHRAAAATRDARERVSGACVTRATRQAPSRPRRPAPRLRPASGSAAQSHPACRPSGRVRCSWRRTLCTGCTAPSNWSP